MVQKNALGSVIRVISNNARNNFDESGMKSQVVGYLRFNPQLLCFEGKCKSFEMDTHEDMSLQF
jgi:hypothetical protein